MITALRIATMLAALAATAAPAAESLSRCDNAPASRGMRARMDTINRQTDKIEWTTDRAEQRELMDLQMKHLREGMRELRHRELSEACRMEAMSSMMEALVRHEQATEERAAR
jgi:hypothetical protein